MEGQPSPATFELSELQTGGQYKLTTARVLDHEVETSCNVLVICSDGGPDPLTTRVNISVSILDLNDNTAQFQQSRYQLNVPENKPPDFVVHQV